MSQNWMPLLWVLVSVPVLLLLQRWIHAHLHGLSLLLTGKPERAVYIYALVLFPGVLLHELSHWLAATLLGVRAGRFSVMPRHRPDGTIQLGYVEYYKGRTLGPLRESIIGGAPLVTGTLVILLIGLRVFGVHDLAATVQGGSLEALTVALSELYATPYALLWIYLLFAISNGMMPSASDRRAWPAFLLLLGALAVIVYLLGLQQAVVDGLSRPAILVFGYLGIALSIAIGVDLFFMLFIAILESIVSRVRGQTVIYGGYRDARE